MAKPRTNFDVEVRSDKDPFCARIIMCDEWPGNLAEARACLQAVCKSWPNGVRTKYMITYGGFICFEWPSSFEEALQNGTTAIRAYDMLHAAAAQAAFSILDQRLMKSLFSRTRYMTLGLDSYMDPESGCWHVELVGKLDLHSGNMTFTGKTYPTAAQQPTLLTMPAATHFKAWGNRKVCVLGCHDLNMFSHRSHALSARSGKKTEKREALREFAQLTRSFKPNVVLQHPHTTDTEKIWNTAISGMKKDFPHITCFASAGRYYRREGLRSSLERVLAATKIGPTLDFIIRPTRPRDR